MTYQLLATDKIIIVDKGETFNTWKKGVDKFFKVLNWEFRYLPKDGEHGVIMGWTEEATMGKVYHVKMDSDNDIFISAMGIEPLPRPWSFKRAIMEKFGDVKKN